MMRLLMSQLNQLIQQRSTPSPPSVQSVGSSGYYVMPDFHNTLPVFTGNESHTEASQWIQSINSTADLHNWPDSFKLEIVRTKLNGPSRNWYIGRSFVNWTNFEEQFISTFVNTQMSIVDRMKLLIARYQRKGESTIEYFHDKARMCRELSLSFFESKQQIVEGFFSRDLCMYLLSRSHSDENQLLTDIVMFTKINDSRQARFKNNERPMSYSTLSKPEVITQSSPQSLSKQPIAKTSNAKPLSNKTKNRCYNCGSLDHISPSCTQPKRVQGSCFKCGSSEHKITSCPQNQSQLNSTQSNSQHQFGPSNSTMVLQPSDSVTPAYVICIDIIIAGSCISNILAVVDTGSPISLIKEKLFPLDFKIPVDPVSTGIVGINGSELVVLNQIYADINQPNIGDPINIKLNVVPDNTIRCDCLLGRNFLSHPRVIFGNNNGKFEIELKHSDRIPFDEILNLSALDMKSNDIDLNLDLSIPENIKNKLYEIYDNFYLNNEYQTELEPIVNDPLEIKLKNNDVFYFQPRRLSYFEKNELQKIIDQLLENKIIRPSNSEYSSPIVLVKKKTGELRLCIDYRELNKRTCKDRYPIPLIDDHLDSLRGNRYFSSIDLKDGFHHIEVAESSRKYTSFTCPLGQFEYCRMPFGLCNGPGKFQRYVNNIFSELIRAGKVIVYFDDIVIATKTLEEQLETLTHVFKLMNSSKLQLRLDKCKFLKTKIIYLGYLVDASGIQPNPKNVAVVKDYPVPNCIKSLKSFIGLASYFRRFIPNFALMAKPLYQLLKDNIRFHFGEDQINAFEAIKSKLSEHPLLCLYNPIAETELHCDASSHGFGSILLQKQCDDKFHPIFFYSHRTTEVESRYHSYELEMLAIINSIKRFRVYLQGIKFKIITDCNSVAMTLAKKDINPRIARWALILQEYDYQIEHRSGTHMQHVDALSRNHLLILEGCTFNQTLSIKQSSDHKIKEIIKLLESSEHKQFELRNGLVYKKSKGRLLFYVPAEMCNHVIRSCHDDMGHIGTNRTIEFIKRVYWFPNMSELIKLYIDNCLKCIVFSSKTGKSEGLLKLVDKNNVPFHTIHIDHYGPLNTTKGNYRHIFIIVDAFSKFLTLYPVRSVKSIETCTKLIEYFSYYSKPIRIISDRGTSFTSEYFKNFCETHCIQHVLIAVGSPQANGQVERYNRTVKDMISKLMHEKGKNWNESLQQVQLAINNTYNRSIKNTPSMLLFGINQHGETNDYLRKVLETENFVNEGSDRDFNKIRQIAYNVNRDAQIKNKKYVDNKRCVAKKYIEGDYVMVKNIDTTPGVNKKHIPKFKGPYEIKVVLPNDRYVVKDIQGFQVTQLPFDSVFESKYIKPWIKNNENK